MTQKEILGVQSYDIDRVTGTSPHRNDGKKIRTPSPPWTQKTSESNTNDQHSQSHGWSTAQLTDIRHPLKHRSRDGGEGRDK
mgnify:CR=1 FL=1